MASKATKLDLVILYWFLHKLQDLEIQVNRYGTRVAPHCIYAQMPTASGHSPHAARALTQKTSQQEQDNWNDHLTPQETRTSTWAAVALTSSFFDEMVSDRSSQGRNNALIHNASPNTIQVERQVRRIWCESNGNYTELYYYTFQIWLLDSISLDSTSTLLFKQINSSTTLLILQINYDLSSDYNNSMKGISAKRIGVTRVGSETILSITQ